MWRRRGSNRAGDADRRFDLIDFTTHCHRKFCRCSAPKPGYGSSGGGLAGLAGPSMATPVSISRLAAPGPRRRAPGAQVLDRTTRLTPLNLGGWDSELTGNVMAEE